MFERDEVVNEPMTLKEELDALAAEYMAMCGDDCGEFCDECTPTNPGLELARLALSPEEAMGSNEDEWEVDTLRVLGGEG